MAYAMLDESPFDGELEELPEDQLHRTDDPDVWGLLDVVTGRETVIPRTIHKTSGDSASGVVGLLFPNGDFVSDAPSRIGQTFVAGTLHDVRPVAGEPTVTYEVAWDGAAPAREFEDEKGELRSEHSRGLLLGEYPNRAEEVLSKFEADRRRGKPYRHGYGYDNLRVAA